MDASKQDDTKQNDGSADKAQRVIIVKVKPRTPVTRDGYGYQRKIGG